jgi:cytochrome c-type biogenesis protein CcmF
MLLAHAGMAVLITGVTLVKGYEVEKDVRMQAGDTVEVGGYTFRLDGFVQVPGPNYEATRGLVTVLKNGKRVRTMFPEKRLYHVQQMPMTEAAIDAGFTRDLYVSLGEPVGNDAWVVRIYHKPFVNWIWGGAFLMALGGILAITDRRYRLARQAERKIPAAATTVSA